MDERTKRTLGDVFADMESLAESRDREGLYICEAVTVLKWRYIDNESAEWLITTSSFAEGGLSPSEAVGLCMDGAVAVCDAIANEAAERIEGLQGLTEVDPNDKVH